MTIKLAFLLVLFCQCLWAETVRESLFKIGEVERLAILKALPTNNPDLTLRSLAIRLAASKDNWFPSFDIKKPGVGVIRDEIIVKAVHEGGAVVAIGDIKPITFWIEWARPPWGILPERVNSRPLVKGESLRDELDDRGIVFMKDGMKKLPGEAPLIKLRPLSKDELDRDR